MDNAVDLTNLKIGDTVHLRCGGDLTVNKELLSVYKEQDGGYSEYREEHPFDIISITPKPEVIEEDV